MPDNLSEDKFTTYYIDFNRDNTRRLILNYISEQYFDQYKMPYPTIQAFTNLVTEINIINCTFTNATSVSGAVMTTLTKSVVIQDSVYQNLDDFGFNTIMLLGSDSVTLTNLTHINVNGTGSNSQYYLFISLNSGGTAYLDSVNFQS